MYSFVTKIAIVVIRALELDMIITALGLLIDIVDVVNVAAHTNKISERFINTFFLFQFFSSIRCHFFVIIECYRDLVSVLYFNSLISSSLVVNFHKVGSSFSKFGLVII